MEPKKASHCGPFLFVFLRHEEPCYLSIFQTPLTTSSKELVHICILCSNSVLCWISVFCSSVRFCGNIFFCVQVERPSFSIESLRRHTANSKMDGLSPKGKVFWIQSSQHMLIIVSQRMVHMGSLSTYECDMIQNIVFSQGWALPPVSSNMQCIWLVHHIEVLNNDYKSCIGFSTDSNPSIFFNTYQGRSGSRL